MNKSFLVLLLFLCLGKTSSAFSQNMAEIEQNIQRIDALFLLDPEALVYAEVLEYSQKIIKKRTFYSNNTVAKAFSLLADTAINKGDLARAMQFSLDGESIANIDETIHLTLMLKITSGYYFKGKFTLAKEMAEQCVTLAKEINNPKYLVKALSYRAMTNAVNYQQQEAIADLKLVEQLLAKHQEFSDHITVLNVLASAHFYLGDYQTAVTLYNKILKLRYDLSKAYNLELTYYNLAKSYLRLEQLDDAFNAFWQANALSEEKQAPIRLAYAKMGLGQVYLEQNKYNEAFEQLSAAKKLFHGQNLPHPYLTTLLSLAKVAHNRNEKNEGSRYLIEAEIIAQRVELTSEQIELYSFLSIMYQEKGMYELAIKTQREYTQLVQKFSNSHLILSDTQIRKSFASEKQRILSLGMAEESDLKGQFTQKYQRQRVLIIVLFIAVLLMFALATFLIFRARATRLNHHYDEVEKPLDYIATPLQTKTFYQQHYKMARKYQYPLIIGYFSIDNWLELEFQFNKKIIAEVARTVARLINQYNEEFNQVGLINQGEYLFLCPHQNREDLKKIFENLTEALKVQFFANLGEFSIKVSYDYQSPSVQDIDPYIFLSQLSESTRAEYSSYKN